MLCSSLPCSVTQSDMYAHTPGYIYSSIFRVFSTVVYHRILRVPCAIQQDLVVYTFIHRSLHLLIQTPSPPFGNHRSVLRVSVL